MQSMTQFAIGILTFASDKTFTDNGTKKLTSWARMELERTSSSTSVLHIGSLVTSDLRDNFIPETSWGSISEGDGATFHDKYISSTIRSIRIVRIQIVYLPACNALRNKVVVVMATQE